jgi:MOSC domain-containing protein YiiM
LHLGAEAVVEVKGLRNPCAQLDHFQPGLMAAVLSRDKEGRLVRRAGVMGVVVIGGVVEPGDVIRAELPSEPYIPLDCV